MQKFEAAARRFGVAFLAGGLSAAAGAYLLLPPILGVSDVKKDVLILLVGFIFGGIFGAEKLAETQSPILAENAAVIQAQTEKVETTVETKLGVDTTPPGPTTGAGL